jgi:hypothetical protein
MPSFILFQSISFSVFLSYYVTYFLSYSVYFSFLLFAVSTFVPTVFNFLFPLIPSFPLFLLVVYYPYVFPL